jgi:hypothetical protein
MWQATHKRCFPGLERRAVWALWRDVDPWHRWDRDIEYARLLDPFAPRARFVLKPRGGPRVSLRFERVEPLQGYTDVVRFPLARMYGIHDMEETPEGLKLRICIRIEGPLSFLWRRLVAEKVAAEAPTQMEGLARHARARAA